ncbi:MAG: ABC transporter ATP-binding protein [Chloroflexi bacterium]|nr:ABC transporter ATP-binding protein [Chloroflexota bacterium]
MSDVAIRAEGLSKRYRIGRAERYRTLRDIVAERAAAPLHALRAVLDGRAAAPRRVGTGTHIWALRDVSFAVRHGEVMGIIGRNGAGKSTLLKVLSRITEPTEGYAEVRGRVGSLLEVGTGFHPELTGRENVYLNGAILGMRRAEIERRFDEIVAFAEVDAFVDTPVKYYSSGMQMRLGFAVAAHFEPEILVVDEVLAVGDAAFQKKCLAKLSEVAREGRTVLFVSHNLQAMAQLCERCILLDQGRMIAEGAPRAVIDRYLAPSMHSDAEVEYPLDATKPVQIRRVRLLGHDSRPSTELDRAKPFRVSLELLAHEDVERVEPGIALDTLEGTRVCDSLLPDELGAYLTLRAGETLRTDIEFPAHFLNAGRYRIRIGVGSASHDTRMHDTRWALSFQLLDLDRRLTFLGKSYPGILRVSLPWKVYRPAGVAEGR